MSNSKKNKKRRKIRIGVTSLPLVMSESPFVPEYDEDFIIEEEEKRRWEYLALGIENKENVLLVGPTGCGKSKCVLQLASVLGQPVQRMNLHGDIRATDFVGEKTIDGGNIVWSDGILPSAMRRGHWLLLDELDAAQPHILFILQAVLEPSKRLVLTANHGEVVEAHKCFRIIATTNTVNKGDSLYLGTNHMNEAFLDRFAIVIKADYPIAKFEIKILIENTGINEGLAKRMVKLAGEVRLALQNETSFCTFSTRKLLNWARFSVKLGNVKKAFNLVVLNRLSEEESIFLDGLRQRIFG
jgi:cobaltochelatase CobS